MGDEPLCQGREDVTPKAVEIIRKSSVALQAANSGTGQARIPDSRRKWRTVRDTPDPAEQGVSLVGTLLVLVILGGLAAVTVASLPSGDTRALLGGGSSSRSPLAPNRPPSLTAAAATAACQADEQTIEEAVAAKHAVDGRYSASLGDLVAGHWLSQVPVAGGYQFTLQTEGGIPTGRVLVNGGIGIAACNALPAP
jgi:hypothetical protein